MYNAKEALSPRPLKKAPITFNAKKLFKLLMLKGSFRFNMIQIVTITVLKHS